MIARTRNSTPWPKRKFIENVLRGWLPAFDEVWRDAHARAGGVGMRFPELGEKYLGPLPGMAMQQGIKKAARVAFATADGRQVRLDTVCSYPIVLFADPEDIFAPLLVRWRTVGPDLLPTGEEGELDKYIRQGESVGVLRPEWLTPSDAVGEARTLVIAGHQIDRVGTSDPRVSFACLPLEGAEPLWSLRPDEIDALRVSSRAAAPRRRISLRAVESSKDVVSE